MKSYCVLHGIELTETEYFPYLKEAREYMKTLDRYVFYKMENGVRELRAIKADDGLTSSECYLMDLHFDWQVQRLNDGLKFGKKHFSLKR